jgi:hypothetical protein
MSDIEFTMRVEHDRVIAGGSVKVELLIRNNRNVPVDLPNPMVVASGEPTYKLKRPDGQTISFKPNTIQQGPPPKRIQPLTIPPHVTWAGSLFVERYDPLRAEGEYQLAATLEWADVHAVASPVVFFVTRAELSGLTISGSYGEDESALALLIQQNKGERSAIFQGIDVNEFEYGRMDIGDIKPLGPVPREARALLPTFSNSARPYVGYAIAVADGGAGLQIYDSVASATLSVSAPAPVRAGLRALVTWDQSARHTDIGLFAVLAGPTPQLAFACARNIEHKPAGLALRPIADLGAAWVAADTAMGSIGQGSPVIVASVGREGDGTRLALMRIGADGQIVARAEAHAASLAPLGPLAVAIAADGHVDAAFAARDEPDSGKLRMVTVASTLDLGKTDAPVVSRSLAPSVQDDRATRVLLGFGHFSDPRAPVALLVLPDYSVRFYRAEDKVLQPQSFTVEASQEVALLGFLRWWYAIVNDGAKLSSHMLQ